MITMTQSVCCVSLFLKYICSRRLQQTTFSDAVFLSALRVNFPDKANLELVFSTPLDHFVNTCVDFQ